MADIPEFDHGAFFDVLSEEGVVAEACRRVEIERWVYHYLRKNDSEFDRKCQLAMEEAGDWLELEARKRAVQGVEQDVYHKDEIVGQKVVYSDTLLALLLKSRQEGFGDKVNLSISSEDDVLSNLSDEKLEQLYQILAEDGDESAGQIDLGGGSGIGEGNTAADQGDSED